MGAQLGAGNLLPGRAIASRLARLGAAMLLLCVFAAIAGATGAAAQGAPSTRWSGAPPQTFEVESYAKDFGVSVEVAEERLALQHAGAAIPHLLETHEGGEYAGVWFDNQTGEFVIPMLASADRSEVRAALGRAHLGADFRIEAASRSDAQLLSIQRQIDGTLKPLIEGELVSTSIDPRANAVVISEAGAAGSSARSRIAGVAAARAGAVEVRPGRVERFAIDVEACSTWFAASPEHEVNERACDKPPRAGVAISDGLGKYCTEGFKAIGTGGAGNRFVLTAGHCLSPKTNNWYSRDSAGTVHQLGVMEQSVFGIGGGGGDWAKIRVNGAGSWWEEGVTWPSRVIVWGSEPSKYENVPIEYESSSFTGQYVCHSGTMTGTSCGNVGKLNVTIPRNFGETVSGATEVHGPSFCTWEGDSGGPVWTGSTALGLIEGGPDVYPCSQNTGYYMEIEEATDSLGVTVGPRVGNPPFAETQDATGIQGFQATGNGVVDPNGLSTEFWFEYGTGSVAEHSSPHYVSGNSGWHPAPVSGLVPLLDPSTTYRYRIAAQNSKGVGYGEEKTFKTADVPPSVTTKPASNGGETYVTLNGSVNPRHLETTYSFEYGTTTSYGKSTAPVSAGSGLTPVDVSKGVGLLIPNTTYHYRIVATNSAGTALGPDEYFTTSWSVPTPVNPEASATNQLQAISCAASTECMAVGQSGKLPLAEQWNGFGWKTQAVPLPSGATEGALKGVSCTSSSFCMAVGYYKDSGGRYKTLAERWTSSKWEVMTTPSKEGEGTVQSFLRAVSCSSPTACTAVGSFNTNVAGTETDKTLGEYWNGSSWEMQLTPNWNGATHGFFTGVSCLAATDCTAVGFYKVGTGQYQTLLGSWNGNLWNIYTSPNPSGAQNSYFEAVSCPAPLQCVAVGQFINSAGATVPMTARWGSPSWQIQLTSGPEGSTESGLRGVSCASPTSCVAVGQYITGSGSRMLAEHWNGTKWEHKYPLNPLDRNFGETALNYFGVSCPYAGACVGVGSYLNSGGQISTASAVLAFKAPPTVTTGAASGVTKTEAILSGTVNPNAQSTSYYFEYGTTTSYGSKTPTVAVGEGQQALSQAKGVTGLKPGTTYHFRLVAFNGAGTAQGEDRSVTTKSDWKLEWTPTPEGAKAAELAAVSCESESSCMAVGSSDFAGIKSQLGARWAGAEWSALSMPKGPESAELHGVSCINVVGCYAVGSAAPTGKPPQALSQRWDGSKWETFSTPAPTAQSNLADVSCTTTGACTAVGDFVDGSGARRALAERRSGSGWVIQTLPEPEGAKQSRLTGVSCTRWLGLNGHEECIAVGFYEDSAENDHPFAEHWSGTKWERISLPQLPGAKETRMTGISCTPKSAYVECSASGYGLVAGVEATFVARWTGFGWTAQTTPEVAGPNRLEGISCAASSECIAVGYVEVAPGSVSLLAERWNGSGWESQSLPTPEGATESFLEGVSCGSVAKCTASGYFNKSGVAYTLAARFS